MDDLSKASKTLNKLTDKDVRIVYLPPATVAASHYIGDEPERHAAMAMDRFVLEHNLPSIKPDMRQYGFNHPNPGCMEGGGHGYEFWVTIPDDMEVPAPLVKKRFEGGLYAAHMIPLGAFEEWDWLWKWAHSNDKYDANLVNDGGQCMNGLLEEHLNYRNNVASFVNGKYGEVQLDLLIPIKERGSMNDDKPMQTARLVVRRFTREDWKELQQLAIDKKNTGGDRYDHAWPTDDKGAGEMAQWCVGQRCFAVCLKDSGKLIGFVRFNSIDDKGQLDLGHMFHSRYRGERYASEAIRPLLAVAFADPKVNGIVARNAVEWPGQLTPLIELGFGELERGQVPNFNGAEGGPIGFVACRMGLTRTEWEASRAEDSK